MSYPTISVRIGRLELTGMLCPCEPNAAPMPNSPILFENRAGTFVWLFDSMEKLKPMLGMAGISQCRISRVADGDSFAKACSEAGIRIAVRPHVGPSGEMVWDEPVES